MPSTTVTHIARTKNSSKHGSANAVQERDEIIKIVTQKSKNKTLTLEESNRLFEQFNETLQTIAEQRNVVDDVDESWALDLLKEDEDEVIVA